MTRSGQLQVPAGRLEYVWHGPAPELAPTLVLLHEGLGCVELWRDFPERLAAETGLGVMAYSRLGYGRSDPVDVPRPLTYMHEEGRDVLPAVLDAAGIQRAILIGHSDGGSIALINAGAVSDPRVRAVVTLAAHVFNEQVCVDSIRAARDAYREQGLRDRLARYHGANVDCAFWGWNRAWLDPDFWHWNIEEFLPGVRVPALVMQGEQDEYGTVAQVDAICRQLGGPVQRRLLADCGHGMHRDQPDALRKQIAAFVSEVLERDRALV
ncbi:MAG: alpha/beta hydrolase [Ectothiorhodospiraceae bacterium]|nr:alpha/beta hydrolase [Ectothiorhodospiraceae bacterium]MCH8503763.1 alpha/beta hydrolase [Ectothiorhodospiraceae bacterium]